MDEVRGEYSEGLLTIFLSGHVDSANSRLIEDEIKKLLDENAPEKVVIDAADLAYISSAGLRVLLHIRKEYHDLRIINVIPEVFDIFDMTGFTQMMEIEKAYRQISIEGCEVIGEGANGKLYRIDKDNVVKVYKNADALKDIQHEREMARMALVLGLPTAISYDVIKVGDSYGSVFELLNASSFAKILIDHPEKTQWCVEQFSDMLSKIHSTEVPKGKLPDMKKTAQGWVAFMKDYLPAEAFYKLKKLVDEVPDDNHMIHGDYHIKNLELQNDEVLIIDMDTLGMGYPIFELGSIYNAFIGFSEVEHDNVLHFLGISYERSEEFMYSFFHLFLFHL